MIRCRIAAASARGSLTRLYVGCDISTIPPILPYSTVLARTHLEDQIKTLPERSEGLSVREDPLDL